ncbi:MAG: hypothetical protein AABZ26_06230 [Chloroflexota bacterium]
MSRPAAFGVLLAAIVVAVVFVQVARVETPGPKPTATATAGPTRTAAATSPAPTATRTATPSPTPTASPSPVTSCPAVPPGGRAGRVHALRDIRVAHQPGFDRVVFDFGPEAVGEQDDVPSYAIERASEFRNTAGQIVPVQGNVHWAVRFQGASIASEGRLVYTGPSSIRPTSTTLVREVRLVDDFEAVMVWGIGLERLQCPRVTTLRSPLRLVVDLPAPP